MGDRYFQCKYCKELKVLNDTDCYDPQGAGITAINLVNEQCNCEVNGTAFKKRLRELTQDQYDMEVALNRTINQ